MDQHVEPPAWLPGGTAPPAGPGAIPAGDDEEMPGVTGDGITAADATGPDPVVYPQDGPPAYESDASFGYLGTYQADTSAGIGYKDEVGGSTGDGQQVPGYPGDAVTSTRPDAAGAYRSRPAARTAQPRHASLVVARVEPWSVMKFSFLISLVAWVVLFVAVALLYYTLSGLGVFAALGKTLSSVSSSQGSSGFDLTKVVSASRVLGYTMLIGAINVVIITVLSTIGAMIYNLVTHLGGGIEVTLRETD